MVWGFICFEVAVALDCGCAEGGFRGITCFVVLLVGLV